VLRLFSLIDVYLKKRWDLLPQLVDICIGYSGTETDLIKQLMTERHAAKESRQDSLTRFLAEENITVLLPQFFKTNQRIKGLCLDERYKWLKSKLEEADKQLKEARLHFNASVQRYNKNLTAFPASLIASKHGFKLRELFEQHPVNQLGAQQA